MKFDEMSDCLKEVVRPLIEIPNVAPAELYTLFHSKIAEKVSMKFC